MRKLLFHMETAYVKPDSNSKILKKIILDVNNEMKNKINKKINW